MSAIAGFDGWGWGVVRAAPEGVRGAVSDPAAKGLTDDQIAALQGQGAKEAIDSLNGEFAAGQLPDVETVTFPGPIAERFYWSNDDVIGIQGPVGSGKTTTLMKSRLRRAIEMPRSVIDGVRRYKVLFIRETYRQLWSTTIPSYLESFPKDLGKWSGGRGDPVTHVIRFEDAHGPIEFVAEFMAFGDDIIASMRGVQTTDIVLNEADTMPVEILTVGIGRIDRWPAREHFAGLPLQLQSYGQIVGDFNAPDEDNWTFKVFHDTEARERLGKELTDAMQQDESARARKEGRDPVTVRPITIAFCNQPGYGEPGCENLQNLSASYYPRQIASMQLAGRGDMVERLVRNKITYMRVGDPVWKREFSRRVHVSDTPLAPIAGLPLLIGLDQGFKGAAVIAQCAGFYRWRILGELHFPEERLMAQVFGQRLADLIEDRWPGIRIESGYGDMAGEHGASQAADENATWNLMVGRAGEFTVRPQVIGTNRIQPRLEAVRAALEAPMEAGEPGLLIDPSCRFLIRGFEARYVWKDDTDAHGDKRKIPDKSFTEANVHDALQYLLLSGHSGDGTSPYARRRPGGSPARMGHNGGPRLTGDDQGGLTTGWNVLEPYGGMQ
ncbi:hypothetical protein SAMN05444007_108239 [Cribrihabitans marinus]|uniref:Terminase-like family protein n=1 Tax=Cribrihabitans marinus TaxID=1227549 RepID=A0A1H7CNP2_9RHOB|nr:hypothetical protein [Cribrihabitans marinus]GGH36234.1 hypothetical protein GCM10010973_30090 [Cribrihabitans marinus]SEJ91383.1 hypothetical protein SAMN05444007_108239 [Cribrihabitans marinus]